MAPELKQSNTGKESKSFFRNPVQSFSLAQPTIQDLRYLKGFLRDMILYICKSYVVIQADICVNIFCLFSFF
jgi:hypothetical protein